MARNLKEPGIKEMHNVIDKKATILDIKSALSSIHALNVQDNEIVKDIELLKENTKMLLNNEEVKRLNGKFIAQEGKITTVLQSIRELQKKVSEAASISIIPHQEIRVTEEKNDEQFIKYMDDTNDKIESLKEMILAFKSDYEKNLESLNFKLIGAVSNESLVNLENKIYKELDKISKTLTKKCVEDDLKKTLKIIQMQIKELYEYIGPTEVNENLTGMKKSLRGGEQMLYGIRNPYTVLNQSHDFTAWNHLPVKETLIPKVLFDIIIGSRTCTNTKEK